MKDIPYDGFRFEHSRKSLSAPNGELKVHIVVVARTVEEATKLAGELLPEQGLRLIERGPDVLTAAKAAGLREGQAKIL